MEDSPLKFDKTGTIVIGCDKYTETVVIPQSVTCIDDKAFRSCYYLSSIVIPEGVTRIGQAAFAYCRSLGSITIPSSVCEFGMDSFVGCSNLQRITVSVNHPTIKDIDGVLFTKQGNTLLIYPEGKKDIHYDIPDGVKIIETHSFRNAKFLSTITVAESVTLIGYNSFSNCESLSSIEIPSSVKKIYPGAFEDCTSLTSIVISKNVSKISASLFQGCSSLSAIFIPIKAKSIEPYSFCGCSSLTSIYIPSRVDNIGTQAFDGCSSLSSISIPENVTKIGKSAFIRCSSLSSIYVDRKNPYFTSFLGVLYNKDRTTLIAYPGGKQSTSFMTHPETKCIGEEAFSENQYLRVLYISSEVKKIGAYAFAGCTNLEEIHIRVDSPASISIDSKAFFGIENCTLFVLKGSYDAYYEDECFSMFKERIIEETRSEGLKGF